MAKDAKKSPGIDLSGLDEVMTGEAAAHASNYQRIAIDRIHPDPAQPRRDMDMVALEELSQSMTALDSQGKPRGVRQPISVRPDPDNPGDYLINYGHRRHRAAQMAKLESVPAIIQDDSNFTDQLLENIQREDLSPEDIAHAIERLISDDGMTAKEVGESLGKPKDWVSLHRQFGRLTPEIRALYDNGIVEAVRGAVELDRARAKHPQAVDELVAELGTRGQPTGWRVLQAMIAKIKEDARIDSSRKTESEASSAEHGGEAATTQEDQETTHAPTQPPAEPSSAAKPPIGDAEGGASSSSGGLNLDPLLQGKEPSPPDSSSEAAAKPPFTTRASGVCITVHWMEDGESMYGQLLQEAQNDDKTVAVYGDDGERRTLPIREVRMVALTQA